MEKVPGFDDSIKLAHKVFDAIAGRFGFILPGDELAPGIQVIAAFGHTPGHIAIEASSSDESVVYISDAVFHPLHIEHPNWLPDAMFIFDVERFQETACYLLAHAVTKKAFIVGIHFALFPSLGRVIKTEEGLHGSPFNFLNESMGYFT